MHPVSLTAALPSVALLALAACSASSPEGGSTPPAVVSPQALFTQVQASIASGQALDAATPCHLNQSLQSPESLQSAFVKDFLAMKVPPFFKFTVSSDGRAVEAIYTQSQPSVVVRIRATLKDFVCDSFAVDDTSSDVIPRSDVVAGVENPSLTSAA